MSIKIKVMITKQLTKTTTTKKKDNLSDAQNREQPQPDYSENKIIEQKREKISVENENFIDLFVFCAFNLPVSCD